MDNPPNVVSVGQPLSLHTLWKCIAVFDDQPRLRCPPRRDAASLKSEYPPGFLGIRTREMPTAVMRGALVDTADMILLASLEIMRVTQEFFFDTMGGLATSSHIIAHDRRLYEKLL